jgi:NAD(P)-dependent dehydrogenase (short-subunit alcohol dehydrogenase family)
MNNVQKLFDLEGRHALVIGAAGGIGAAVAAGLAAYGAVVVAADVDLSGAERCAETIREAGGSASAVSLNIMDESAVRGQIEAMPRFDICVCTPAMNVRKPILETTVEEFGRVVDLNLKGSFIVMREAGRRMAAQRSGSIILFSSIRALTVEPGQGVYAATKAGTLQMVRALAAELGPHGVRANAIAPGVVETPLTAPIKANPEWYRAYAEKSALGRWAQPSEMVGPAIYLASDAASFVTGTLTIVDGGWTAIDGRFTPPL